MKVDASLFRGRLGRCTLGEGIVAGVEYCIPILVPLLAIKLFELGLSTRESTFATNVPAIFIANVMEYVRYSGLMHLIGLGAVLVWPVRKLFRIRTVVSAFGASIVGIVLLKAIQIGVLHGSLDIGSSYMLSSAWEELQSLRAVWSDDAWFTLAAIAIVGGVFMAIESAPVRSGLYMALMAGVSLWLAFDASYFVATRSVTAAKALRYLLQSPGSALMASRDAVDFAALAVGASVLALIAICLYCVCRSRSGKFNRHTVGFYTPLWIIVFLLVLPVSSADPSLARLANNSIFRVLREFGPSLDGKALTKRDLIAAEAHLPPFRWQHMRIEAGENYKPYNVVIILLESTRASATGLNDPQLTSTPYLSELAKESLVVDSMWAVIPRTSAAWVASLAGIYPSTAAVSRAWSTLPERLRKFHTGLPTLLKAFGYDSAFLTATNLGLENEGMIVEALGFDTVVAEKDLDHAGFETINAYGIEDLAVVGPTLKFVDAAVGRGRPFMATIMTNVGHYPYNIPATQRQRTFPGKSSFEQKYLNGVAYQDRFVAEIVDGLRQRNLLDSTIVVIMGDHGDGTSAEQSTQRAFVLNDDVLHVPALLRFPGAIGTKGRSGGLRQEIDVPVTILDALGLNMVDGELPGISILSDHKGHGHLFFSSHMESTFLGMRTPATGYVLDPNRNVIDKIEYSSSTVPNEIVGKEMIALYGSKDEQLLQVRADLLYWSAAVDASLLSRPIYR